VGTKSGGSDLDRDTYNWQYGRLMSWLGENGLRYPISRFAVVSATSAPPSSAVIVTCEVDGRTVYVRAVYGQQLEWASP
jgi:hypothetical protein